MPSKSLTHTRPSFGFARAMLTVLFIKAIKGWNLGARGIEGTGQRVVGGGMGLAKRLSGERGGTGWG